MEKISHIRQLDAWQESHMTALLPAQRNVDDALPTPYFQTLTMFPANSSTIGRTAQRQLSDRSLSALANQPPAPLLPHLESPPMTM